MQRLWVISLSFRSCLYVDVSVIRMVLFSCLDLIENQAPSMFEWCKDFFLSLFCYVLILSFSYAWFCVYNHFWWLFLYIWTGGQRPPVCSIAPTALLLPESLESVFSCLEEEGLWDFKPCILHQLLLLEQKQEPPPPLPAPSKKKKKKSPDQIHCSVEQSSSFCGAILLWFLQYT